MTTPNDAASAANGVRDLVAGLSVAGLLLPEAVAYASIGNVPPQMAVIALFAGMACYAMLGSSRFAIVSATSSSAAVLAAASASIGGDAGHRLALSIGLVILSGLYFLFAGAARMGGVTDYIAKPVLRGFSFGLAVVIILKQLPKIVGIAPDSGDLWRFAYELFGQASLWNFAGLAVGAGALLLLFALARFRYVPAALIVVALGIAAQRWIGLEQYGIKLVGPISIQLVMPSLPQLPRNEWLRLGELALAMVLMLYAESYSSIRSFAIKHGDKVAPNRDLAALGVANLVSGLFHGMPVGAGYSATSANEAAGAVSRLAGASGAVAIAVIVYAMLPLAALTPEPVLAAIVIHAVSHTLTPAVFRPYFKWRRDRLVVIASVSAVLVLGVLDGLLAAIGVSMLMALRGFSESTVAALGRLGETHDFVSIALHPEARAQPGMLILRPEEPLFFANVERILVQVRRRIRETERETGHETGPPIHTVILSLEESPDLDTTSLEALCAFYADVTARGKQVLFCRLKDAALDVLKRVDLAALPPQAISGLSVDDAVRSALEHESLTRRA